MGKLTMRTTFKGIIFDMDGTLLDTLDDVVHSMNKILERHGSPHLGRDFYRASIHEGDENFVKKILAVMGNANGDHARLLKEFREEYEANCDVFTKPYDRVHDLLDAVREMGLRTAVLSNKDDRMVKELAAKMFPRNGFVEAVGMQDKAHRKPDPRNALFIARSLRAHPSEVLLLGDSAVDMKTAAAAGMLPAGALWGYGSAGELRESGASILVERPLDLLAHLG